MTDFKCIEFVDDKLKLIDQTKLPLVEEYIISDELERIAISIERLEVRGAPAIGVTAGYAIALAMKNCVEKVDETFKDAYKRLARTRPTAVNLFWALDEMRAKFNNLNIYENVYQILLEKAKQIHQEDIDKCDAMGRNGLDIFIKKSVVLTHCNTGQLATGGDGTAFSVIKKGYENGLVDFVYADESRPLLQGSRLTAFELSKNGIPFKINTDSMAAHLMKLGKIDLVITGSDRIAANGDAANKIGTYSLAVLCKHHNIPFYIAAPTTTIDSTCKHGDDIEIEERASSEITSIHGNQVTRDDYDVFNPAFDVTPNEFIAGIITEEKLHKPPYKF